MRQRKSNRVPLYLAGLVALLALPQRGEVQVQRTTANLRFAVSFPAERSQTPLDGRVLLMLSIDGAQEPRQQINDSPKTQQIFGIDVDGLEPGQQAVVGSNGFGYPVKSLAQVPAGTYWVQALLHKYETFKRSDGHTVKLPMDRGEGQHWNLAPGNIYSKPQQIKIDPSKSETISITLDQEIPPIAPPKDTKYIKHVTAVFS